MAHHFINTNTAIIFDQVVAAGAAFNTGVLDVSAWKNLMLVLTNSDGGTRTLQISFYLEDGVTVIWGPVSLRTVGAGATELQVVGPGIVSGAGYAVLPTRMRFNVLAGGSSNFRMTIYAR